MSWLLLSDIFILFYFPINDGLVSKAEYHFTLKLFENDGELKF